MWNTASLCNNTITFVHENRLITHIPLPTHTKTNPQIQHNHTLIWLHKTPLPTSKVAPHLFILQNLPIYSQCPIHLALPCLFLFLSSSTLPPVLFSLVIVRPNSHATTILLSSHLCKVVHKCHDALDTRSEQALCFCEWAQHTPPLPSHRYSAPMDSFPLAVTPLQK